VIDDGALGCSCVVALGEEDEHVLEPQRGLRSDSHGRAAERLPEPHVRRDVANAVMEVPHRHAGLIRRRQLRGRFDGNRQTQNTREQNAHTRQIVSDPARHVHRVTSRWTPAASK
jgi:hypothetical protein